MSKFNDKVNTSRDELPYNLEAEQAIIASILRDNSLFYSVPIDDSLFFNTDLRNLYQCIKKLAQGKSVIDVASILDMYDNRNINTTKAKEHLKEIGSLIIHKNGYENTVDILKSTFMSRQLVLTSTLIKDIAHGTGDPFSKLTEVANLISGIKVDQTESSCADGLDEMEDQILNGSGVIKRAISTGFPSLDKALRGGFRHGDYDILAANSSGGKSIMAAQLAWSLARDGHNVLFFSVEMGKDMINARSAAHLGRFDVNCILEKSNYRPEAQIKKAFSIMRGTLGVNLHIDYTADLSVQLLEAKIAKHTARFGKPDFVIVDYLQYLECVGRFNGRVDKVQKITNKLKNIAKMNDICVIALSQLNMDAAKEGEPQLHHLAECPSQIWRDADNVLLMHCTESLPGNLDLIKCKIAKGRNTGTSEIFFKLSKCTMTFIDEENTPVNRNISKVTPAFTVAEQEVDKLLQGDKDDSIPEFGKAS